MEKKSSDWEKLSSLSKNQDEREKETNSQTELKKQNDDGDGETKLIKKKPKDDEDSDDESQSELIESVVDSQAVGSNEIVSAVAGTSIGIKEQNLKDNDFHLISSFYDEDEESKEEFETKGKGAVHGSQKAKEEDKASESGEGEEEDLFKTPSSTQRSAETTRHPSQFEKPKKTLKFSDLMPTRRFKKQHSNASMGINELSSEVSNFNSNEDDLMLDLADLLTVIEEARDESSKQENDDGDKQFNLKQTVSTVLLSKKWNNTLNQKEETGKKGKLPKVLKFQPTFRMEPLINIFKIEHAITDKTQKTFESILQKYGKYDTEYTPKLLRCITEIIKQQVKSFKLDRYKVVVHVTFIKKLAGQSVQVISKSLWSNESDLRICIRYDAYSYYAIGLIFLAYHE